MKKKVVKDYSLKLLSASELRDIKGGKWVTIIDGKEVVFWIE